MPSNSPMDKGASAVRPGLYVVTTPIGHMGDITLRALEVLAAVDLIAAEDTRHTRRLLAYHRIDNQLISYHEHNETQRSAELTGRLEAGAAIALVSDAGTPTVSDPGYRLVQAAAERRIPVIPIPGVSAAVAALSVSGLPTDQFTFVGFPLRKKNKRLAQLSALAHLPHTLIFYQSPQRIVSFVGELITALGNRQAVLAREMTKLHEEFIRAPLADLSAELESRDSVKGECTLLVAGAPADSGQDPEAIDAAVREALDAGERRLSDIARDLAARFHVGRGQIYEKALKYRNKKSKK